jgi:hypothetical protein
MTGILGSITGWASVDFLRTAQIAAALLAALVSLGTAIIIAPKVWAQLRAWCIAIHSRKS